MVEHSTITVEKMFPHVDEVVPFSTADEECFRELREVLEKHDALRRFGVCLLHEHFHVKDEEILVETCDPENRVLVTRPMLKQGLKDQEALETSWSLENAGPIKTCRQACTRVRGGDHQRLHYPI